MKALEVPVYLTWLLVPIPKIVWPVLKVIVDPILKMPPGGMNTGLPVATAAAKAAALLVELSSTAPKSFTLTKSPFRNIESPFVEKSAPYLSDLCLTAKVSAKPLTCFCSMICPFTKNGATNNMNSILFTIECMGVCCVGC
jgi:hypothetical protein